MSKQLYLVYNPLGRNYIFSDSPDYRSDQGRSVIGEQELEETFKKRVNPKRKSILNLIDIPDDVQENVKDFFNGTKVRVQKKSQ